VGRNSQAVPEDGKDKKTAPIGQIIEWAVNYAGKLHGNIASVLDGIRSFKTTTWQKQEIRA
jgi:hypothetical protein